MLDLKIKHPEIESDELEITTLGVGRGKGESIVIHLGDNQWAIIDSCMYEERPLALFYLETIKVPTDNVRFIICTHWHEDHTEGLAQLLRECKNSKLCTPPVGEYERFLQYIFSQIELDSSNSGAWKCMEECIQLIDNGVSESRSLLFANEGVVISENDNINLRSLTPPPQIILDMNQALLKMDHNAPDAKLASDIKENMCSTVLSYYSKECSALLGGDLENNLTDDMKRQVNYCDDLCPQYSKKGWCHLVQSVEQFQKHTYSFVKIPHHSSCTAFCSKLWGKHTVKDNTVGTTTYYIGRGEPLPRKAMLVEYHKLCDSLFSTYAKDETPKEEKTPMPNTVDVSEYEFREFEDGDGIEILPQVIDEGPGIIICRRKKNEERWDCKPYGSAVQITDELLSHYHDSYFKESQNKA